MPEISHLNPVASILLVSVVGLGAAGCTPHAGAAASVAPPDAELSRKTAAPARSHQDLSGRKRVGMASSYARKFAGREMADGHTMDPHGDNAASKTLPLGTTAKVTNTETGQSAIATLQDRGPYVTDRIVDLSPTTTEKIGITQDNGVAKVQVAPITVPLPDGSLKRGVAPPDAKR
jgi:rare lipoprotein A